MSKRNIPILLSEIEYEFTCVSLQLPQKCHVQIINQNWIHLQANVDVIKKRDINIIGVNTCNNGTTVEHVGKM